MEQITPFKELSTKKKIEHIWEYYKFPIIAGIIIIYALFSIVHHLVTYKDPALEVVMVNSGVDTSTGLSPADAFNAFLSSQNADGEVTIKADVNLDSETMAGDGYTIQQALDVLASTDHVDLFLADEKTFVYLAGRTYFTDLSQWLPEDLIETVSDSIVYVTYEDGSQHAVGIRIDSSNSFLTKVGMYPNGMVVGSGYYEEHPELVTAFIRTLIAEDISYLAN